MSNRRDCIRRRDGAWKACHSRGDYLPSMENPSKTVLVTGATSGIGLAVTQELAASGFAVVATARSQAKAEQLLRLLSDSGLTARVLVCDFEKSTEIAAAMVKVFEIWPTGPWAVVNNAGFALPGAIEDVTGEMAQKQLLINVLAPAEVIRALLPSMRARGSGRIINISSFSGRVATPFLGWYSASKFALEALSDSLRVEVREFGIEVVLIEPSGFASLIWANALLLLPADGLAGPYRRAYAKAQKLINSNLPGPTPVAKIVRIALESQKPKARYPIGKGTRAIPLLRVIPSKLLDLLLQINLGLSRPFTILRMIIRRLRGRRR